MTTAAALDPEGVTRLLSKVLAGAPKLPGAACRNRHDLFDDREPATEDAEDAAARHALAQAVCHRCPSLDDCAAWSARLRVPQRPAGVLAGKLNTPRPVGRPPIHRKDSNA